MASITKDPKILTWENLSKIEELLGLDGIHVSDGSCIMTARDGRMLIMYECETIFSTKRGENGKKGKKTC